MVLIDLLFFSNELLALFARDMDDGHFEHVESFPCAVDFARMLLLRVVRSIFESELARGRPLFYIILDDADASEYDNTAVCRGVFFGDDLIAVDDGEGDIWVLLEGIDLVSRYRRVKVDVRAVVDVADGDGVRELLITREGEKARCIAVQDFLGHFLCELLAFAAHRTEHIFTPYTKMRHPRRCLFVIEMVETKRIELSTPRLRTWCSPS